MAKGVICHPRTRDISAKIRGMGAGADEIERPPKPRVNRFNTGVFEFDRAANHDGNAIFPDQSGRAIREPTEPPVEGR
jgi:hypothetical protein